MKKVYIVLQDGHVFEGKRFGAEGEAVGELVFNTGMVGYIEELTDASNCGKIVMNTFPLAGNYGIIEDNFDGDRAYLSAFVVREWCEAPSNFRCQYNLDEFLKKQGVAGVYGVDTREITRLIRENGTMNAKITDDPDNTDFSELRAYKIKDALKAVSTGKEYTETAENGKYNVTLIDCGKKKGVIKELLKNGCNVRIVPFDTSAENILASSPDGVVITDGPGAPEDNTSLINEIKSIAGRTPVFGIGLGHQMTALALGGKTEKLKHGHRGANQPVKSLLTGKTFMTLQNQGYAVIPESVEASDGREIYVNANDGVNEGLVYPAKNIMTVQFAPDACTGPLDTEFLFEKFVEMMGGNR